ncbi:MAG: hypothetical protein ACLSUW_07340 [Akkermansia sp.]
MASFKAPKTASCCTRICGGQVGGHSGGEKLKPGGNWELLTKSPPSFHQTRTDCPGYSSGLHRYAQGGETVVIKITNMQIPGVITEASPIPGADGKRRIIITPKVPASQIFAPAFRPGDHQGPTGLIS